MTSLLMPLAASGAANTSPAKGRTLVFWFSRGGNTRVIAGRLRGRCRRTGSRLHRSVIIPTTTSTPSSRHGRSVTMASSRLSPRLSSAYTPMTRTWSVSPASSGDDDLSWVTLERFGG